MKLSAAVQKTYPRCTHYIRNLLRQVGQLDVVVKAMEKYGQLSPSQFRVALSWGTWPDLQVVPLGIAYGGFDKTTPDIIKIDPFVMSRHEAGTDGVKLASGRVVPILGVTILHEMAHWGDWKDRVQYNGEEGNEFEVLVYGEVVLL